ncbi:MAG: LuxR C-terminal-related transcriptional regulator [Thermomicrobiales bacterium]
MGRHRELAEIRALLADPAVRLVVLSGPGGVGKTRLATEIAKDHEGAFADGVIVVHLSRLRIPTLVLPTIAAALGIDDRRDADLLDAVIDFLAPRECLLVLDNFEQVIGAAPALTSLLTAAPQLTILVTSRVVLGLYGEYIYPVPPMVMPTTDVDGALTLESLLELEGVQLFVERARAIVPEFQLQRGDVPAMRTIIEGLDGLPLAIELAASRLRTFSLHELAARVGHRLDLLEHPGASGPDRWRTMRKTIAWSYDLLPSEEQAMFRRLSLFIGTWTLDDARAMSQGSQGANDDDWSVIGRVSSLVDKSLVRRVASEHGQPSFGMLETLREYGIEQLHAANEYDDAVERYIDYVLGVVRDAAPHLTGADQVLWLDRLAALHADVRVVFQLVTAREPAELALRLATDMWRFGYSRGHVGESLEWLEIALARAPERNVLRAEALNAAGVLLIVLGDDERSRRMHEEALAIAEESGHDEAAGMAFLGLGDIAVGQGDYDWARRMVEAADSLLNGGKNRRAAAVAKTNLGNLLWTLGDVDRALAAHAESRVLFEAIGDRRGIAWTQTNIGRIALDEGDYARAVADLQGAVRLYDLLDDRMGLAEAFAALAEIAFAGSDYARAAALLGASEALRIDIEYPVPAIDQERYRHLTAETRDRGPEAFDQSWRRGQSLRLDEVVALALGVTPPKPSKTPVKPPPFEHRAFRLLTPREREVLQLLREGKSNLEIGQELSIGVRTVQTHVANILRKLQVNSRTAAVARTLRGNLD